MDPDNKGYIILLKMGWHPGEGLGRMSDGIREPIMVIPRPRETALEGLGYGVEYEVEEEEVSVKVEVAKVEDVPLRIEVAKVEEVAPVPVELPAPTIAPKVETKVSFGFLKKNSKRIK